MMQKLEPKTVSLKPSKIGRVDKVIMSKLSEFSKLMWANVSFALKVVDIFWFTSVHMIM